MMNTSYPSKLLLFGEYTILTGSMALAIPYYGHKLSFSMEPSSGPWSKYLPLILNFSEYVDGLHDLEVKYKTEKFRDDINKGMNIKSDIPVGYGLGSSGALVAAFYENYSEGSALASDWSLLAKELGKLESFFHQSSSGFDPLISLIQKPILIKNKREFHEAHDMKSQLLQSEAFLLDSNQERRTAPLVQKFQEMCSDDVYISEITDYLVPDTDKLIQCFLSSNFTDFIEVLEQVSVRQFALFADMIPEPVKEVWSVGIESGDYFLKLCGAGGGGYFLGFGELPQDQRFQYLRL